jgi:predicted outer membrane protein
MNELSAEYIRAKDLDRRIKVSAQMAQQSLYDMCVGLKEMRDGKLYKELGYANFEEYSEKEHGLSRMQAYSFISISENLSSDFVTSMLQIGTTKLTLLAQLDEPTRAEIVETTDLESATVRELKGKIKALAEQAEQAEERAEALKKSENKAWGEVSKLKTDSEMRSEKISQLEAEIKELESRPVEVAVSHEEENLRKAIQKMNNDFDKEFAEQEEANMRDRRELLQAHDREMEQLRAEYEKKLAELPSGGSDGGKAAFKAYLANAIDAAERLYKFLCDNPEETYLVQANKFTKAISEKIGGIKK